MHQILQRAFSSKILTSKSMNSTLFDLGSSKVDSSLLKTALKHSKSVSCHLFNSSGHIARESDSVEYMIADYINNAPSSLSSTLSRLSQQDFPTENWPQKQISYFPKSLKELSNIELDFLTFEKGLESEHPSFSDPEYRARRQEIAEISKSCSLSNDETPIVNYTCHRKRNVENGERCFKTLPQRICV